ncbi:MAG: hypothetical protein HYX91_01635 [Chloroflexi bacterium]|nr:hypothetical protein [Chloroflexota bacterium]
MKLYNNYIITVALLLLLSTVVLVILGQRKLDIYYSVYIIAAFVATELYVYFGFKARRGLTLVSIFLSIGLAFMVTVRVIRMLMQ